MGCTAAGVSRGFDLGGERVQDVCGESVPVRFYDRGHGLANSCGT
jgi:hypothetical protein